MSAWRRKALEALPDQKHLIDTADSPMALWIELHILFEKCVRQNDTGRIRAILNYAAWCISEASGHLPNDTSTAAICAFYEDIASNKDNWPRFVEWFTPSEFAAVQEFFGYHLDGKELQELVATFRAAAKRN